LISTFFRKGDLRSIQAKKHIAYSMGLRLVSILASYILVPLCLNYLGKENYGIWITLSSIVAWIGFFDIGIGHGLRNRFAEAKAQNKILLVRNYVSTTYALAIIIFGSFFVLFAIINPFLNWSQILNTSPELKGELHILVWFVVLFFILRFVLSLIGIIFVADQKPAINNSIFPLANIISLIIIFILTKTSDSSLLYLGITISAIPVIILIFMTFYYFNKDYRAFKPGIKYVDFKYFKDIGGLGIQFFIIQIAVLIIFYSDNLIITRIFSPAEVTPYNIAYKYFSMLTIVFTTIVTPFWSAYTDAFTKQDFQWIRKTNKDLIKVWFFIVLAVIILLSISGFFYRIWIEELSGEKIHIPFRLSLFMGLFILISTWNNIYSNFINGTGKIRLQLYTSVIVAAINIPISIFLAKNMGLGSSGVILGTCICLFSGTILGPVQYHKIINKKDKGIWGK
jgi:O-antigen/teichoic acid export membrane protein